jgi:hypothetical protein
MARVGPNHYAAALKQPHVTTMEFTGKPMNGYVLVQPLGLAEDEQLQRWIDLCFAFVRSLPVKALKILSNSADRHIRKDSRSNC